jgi:putative FmdB family regulatory protein
MLRSGSEGYDNFAMPTYEYECRDCGHRFEAYHPATELIEACERCSGEVRRLFHPVGIIFKGSGFYTTDYARKGGDGDKSASGDNGDKAESKQKETAAG